MANLPISALPPLTTLAAADEMAVATGGVSKKVTIAQISSFVQTDSPATVSLGMYGVRGAQGQNNTSTPNTQYDFDADQIQLVNPADGSIVVRQNPSALTNNILTAGPAAGGRDQAGAFSANSWIHFYWIWNGTTLSTIASLSAPTGAAGPILPATYTHWAYAGAVRYNATPVLVKTRLRGSWAFYDAEQPALSAGTATAETAVNLNPFVPPNAGAVQAEISSHVLAGSTIANNNATLRCVAGSNFISKLIAGDVTAGAHGINALVMRFPNIAQQIFYLNTPAGVGATGDTTILVQGYGLPNGGE